MRAVDPSTHERLEDIYLPNGKIAWACYCHEEAKESKGAGAATPAAATVGWRKHAGYGPTRPKSPVRSSRDW